MHILFLYLRNHYPGTLKLPFGIYLNKLLSCILSPAPERLQYHMHDIIKYLEALEAILEDLLYTINYTDNITIYD